MSNEFKVGLMAIVAGVLLYFGFNYLKGIDFFSSTNKYYIKYDHISGLTVSNNVIVSGLAVGRVSDIQLDQKNNEIVVQIDVSNNIVVGKGAVATLANSDFLGGKAIQLDVGDLTKPLESGDTIKANIDDELQKILASTGSVAEDLSVTIGGINEILRGMQGSGEKIKSAITELDKTLRSVNNLINRNSANLSSTILEVKTTTVELRKSVSQITPILQKTDGLLDSLHQIDLERTIRNTDSLLVTLNETVKQFKENDGTLGKLMSEDSLYVNLNQLLLDLDKTINHFNEYPKDFLKPLGRKNKKLKGVKED